MKNTTLALLILAAIFALVSVSGVQTRKAYIEQVADDKSFTMQVPGEYVQLENLEYLRQQYGVSGNAVFGFGTSKTRGVLVIRRVIDDIDPTITNEEIIDQLSQDQTEGALEKVIINDVSFAKTTDHTNQSSIFITYYKQSLYTFTFDNFEPKDKPLFETEVYNMMNSLKFNPDPNI